MMTELRSGWLTCFECLGEGTKEFTLADTPGAAKIMADHMASEHGAG